MHPNAESAVIQHHDDPSCADVDPKGCRKVLLAQVVSAVAYLNAQREYGAVIKSLHLTHT